MMARRIRLIKPLIHHPRIVAGTAMAVGIMVGAAILLQPGGSKPTSVDPRTRISVDYSACLLTGPDGSTAQPAKAVWAGLQQAALTTSERASEQATLGAQTLDNAETYINTMALRQCRAIVAVGTLPTQAAELRADAFPSVSFVLVAVASQQTKRPNVTVIAPASAETLTASVSAVLVDDFDRAKP